MSDVFQRLSRALIGVASLEAAAAEAYLARLGASPHEPNLRRLLQAFAKLTSDGVSDDDAARRLLDDEDFRLVAAQIALIWLTSTMQDTPASPSVFHYGDADQYFGALVWDLIGAHPPGLSGGYFGHWRYRPDNEPSP